MFWRHSVKILTNAVVFGFCISVVHCCSIQSIGTGRHKLALFLKTRRPVMRFSTG